jgi:hypothetical protein
VFDVSFLHGPFETFVITTYAIKTTNVNPQCTLNGGEAAALEAVKFRIASGSTRGKVIETGWKLPK